MQTLSELKRTLIEDAFEVSFVNFGTVLLIEDKNLNIRFSCHQSAKGWVLVSGDSYAGKLFNTLNEVYDLIYFVSHCFYAR